MTPTSKIGGLQVCCRDHNEAEGTARGRGRKVTGHARSRADVRSQLRTAKFLLAIPPNQ